MNDSDRVFLGELRRLLLQLHKILLDWQRRDFEQDRIPMQTTELLQVILHDRDFAWLRPMSGLIVKIDETIENDSPEEPARISPLLREANALIAPEAGSQYALRYHAALQELPEAVLAHRDLLTLLRLQSPSANA